LILQRSANAHATAGAGLRAMRRGDGPIIDPSICAPSEDFRDHDRGLGLADAGGAAVLRHQSHSARSTARAICSRDPGASGAESTTTGEPPPARVARRAARDEEPRERVRDEGVVGRRAVRAKIPRRLPRRAFAGAEAWSGKCRLSTNSHDSRSRSRGCWGCRSEWAWRGDRRASTQSRSTGSGGLGRDRSCRGLGRSQVKVAGRSPAGAGLARRPSSCNSPAIGAGSS